MRSGCSLSEPNLWDYIITNETMEATGKQLEDIAGRALAGQIGNGIAELPEPSTAEAAADQKVLLQFSCFTTHADSLVRVKRCGRFWVFLHFVACCQGVLHCLSQANNACS